MPWRKPAKPSKGSASGFGTQSHDTNPGKALPDSENLWVHAYSELRKRNNGLVCAFEKILTTSTTSGTSIEQPADNVRHVPITQMSELVDEKIKYMNERQWKISLGNRSIEVRTQVDRILKIVTVAKDFGSSLASLDPIHAGLPWAGLLVNDSQQRKSAMDGLEEIAKLIRRFSEAENIYVRHISHRLTQDVRKVLLELYAQILEFEMRAACQFDRNTLSQAFRNTLKLDGWEDMLKCIRESETTCNILTRIIDTECQIKWNEKLEAMILEQTRKVDELLRVAQTQDKGLRRANTADLSAETQNRNIENYTTEELSRCHAVFRTTDYEFHKNKNPTRVDGTCEWLLNHPFFERWNEDDGSANWLWVTANPGCGKSVLAKYLVDRKPTNYYFFFKDDSEKNRSASHALCAFLHQIISHHTSYARFAIAAYRANGDQLPVLFESLWAIFLSILEETESPLICILDALDECAEVSRMLLLQKLSSYYSTHKHDSKLRLIMTSRPNTPIGDALWRDGIDPVTIQLTGEHETQVKAISKEIDLYILSKMHSFRDLRRHRRVYDDADEIIFQKLIDVENRTYLWVSLIFPELEANAGVSKRRLLDVVDHVPATVQQAYEKILERSSNVKHARHLLHIVLAAQEPLTLRQMNLALALYHAPDPMTDTDLEPEASFETMVRELCGQLVVIQDSRLYLIHQTAREFLQDSDERQGKTDQQGRWCHTFKTAESHRLIVFICLQHLLYMRLNPLYADITPEGFPSRRLTDKDFQKYSLEFWSFHFRHACLSRETFISEKVFVVERSSPAMRWTWIKSYELVLQLCDNTRNLNRLTAASSLGHSTVVEHFLHSISIEDAIEIDGSSPLWWAIKNKHTDTVDILLGKSPENSQLSTILPGALHLAAHESFDHFFSRKLNFGDLDLNHTDSLGRTALMWAATTGNEMVIKALLSASSNEKLVPRLFEAWQLAAYRGREVRELHHNILEKLRNGQIDIANVRKHVRVILRQAVKGGRPEVVRVLLSDIGLPSTDMEEAFFSSVERGHAGLVKEFLAQGVSLETRNEHGQTALHIACQKDHEHVVNLLLEAGADANAIANKGWYAVYGGFGETVLYGSCSFGPDKHLPRVAKLLNHGVALDVQCRDGETALFRAVAENSVPIVKMLLDSGADASIPNAYGVLPLEHARLLTADSTMIAQLEQSQSMSQDYSNSTKQSVPRATSEYDADTLASITWPNKICRPLESLLQILGDTGGIIDAQVFGQILEMDDEDDIPTCSFSRSIINGCFDEIRWEWPKIQDALICADFPELRLYIGDFFKGNCDTVGLVRISAICNEVLELGKNRKLWVGLVEREEAFTLSHDLAVEEMDIDQYTTLTDAEALHAIKIRCRELLEELKKAEDLLIAFYQKIQNPELMEELLSDAREETVGSGVDRAVDIPIPEDKEKLTRIQDDILHFERRRSL